MADFNFTQQAKVGKWETFIDPVALRGYFEHDDEGEGGGLWFSKTEDGKLEITDYDGRAVLPKNVCLALLQMGVIVSDSFLPDGFVRPVTPQVVQVELKLTRKDGVTMTPEQIQEWARACLNCNVNNIEAEVIVKP